MGLAREIRATCLRGKWERKENGEGKGARENIFPCLLGEKMGEERKWGRNIVWVSCPISLPTFPPKMGGLWDKFVFPLSTLHFLSFHSTLGSILLHRVSSCSHFHIFLLHSCLHHAQMIIILFGSYVNDLQD